VLFGSDVCQLKIASTVCTHDHTLERELDYGDNSLQTGYVLMSMTYIISQGQVFILLGQLQRGRDRVPTLPSGADDEREELLCQIWVDTSQDEEQQSKSGLEWSGSLKVPK
jgi:hypothetical protein